MLGRPFARDHPPAVPKIVSEGALHTIVRWNGLDRGHHVPVLLQGLLSGIAGPERGRIRVQARRGDAMNVFPDALDAYLRAPVDGIVVEGVGAGNVNLPFYHAICDALEAGIPVVLGVRIFAGTGYFAKGHEGSFRTMIERGAISAGYLSGIKARVLLMVALAHTRDLKQLSAFFAQAAAPSLPQAQA